MAPPDPSLQIRGVACIPEAVQRGIEFMSHCKCPVALTFWAYIFFSEDDVTP